MKTLRAKSLCCGAQVKRKGKRRRQCKQCGRTWRNWRRRRGRRPIRGLHNLAKRVLLTYTSLRARSGLSRQAWSYRFRKGLQQLLRRTAAPQIPSGSLILLVDGVRFRFEGKKWTLYIR